MKASSILRFIPLLLLLAPSVALGSGVLKGVVVDTATNEPLVGAHILLKRTSFGGATDLLGTYAVRSIPAGHYTVRCSYVGYVTREKEITIADDATAELNFALVVTTVQGSEIVVTGQAVGQVAAGRTGAARSAG